MKALFLLLLPAVALAAAPSRGADDYVDSQAIQEAFAKDLGKLYESGKCVKARTLDGQLRAWKPMQAGPRKPGRREQPWDEVYARARDAVVLVGTLYKCDRCAHWHVNCATGFILDERGLVATDYHVVEDEDHNGATMGVRTWDGRVFPVREVAACDRTNDLAVLRTDAVGLDPLPLAADVRVGEEVAVLSHTAGHFWSFAEGTVAAKTLHPGEGRRDTRRQILITADFARGSSGGPILNRRGAVVGLVESTSSVYYEQGAKTNRTQQMVWKACTPSACLLELLSAPRGP